MPAIAYLECSRCHHRVSAETSQAVCPVDAGAWLVRYDMDALRASARRERPAVFAAGASAGMWRYADVLPEATPVTLGEGWTPMRRSRRYDGLLLKDEGANPTGSYEARGMGLAVTMARHYGLKELAVAAAGDAAVALAAYAAAGQIVARLYMPRDVSFAHHVEAVAYGAEVTLVEGAVCDGAWALMEAFRVEGAKTLGYELVEQLGWEYPDAVVCPAGVALMGLRKAFEEMEPLGWVKGKRPRIYASLAAVEAAGPAALAADTVQATGGRVVGSEDAVLLASLLDWAREEGILLSLEGAAATAAYDSLRVGGEIKAGERVVLVNPGGWLKDVDATASALKLKRPVRLPTSLPVGGIITPV